jgi:competence protein ComEC
MRWVIDTFLAERDRWFLWLPVFVGAGICFYYALPAEPSLTPGLILLGLIAACAVFFRRRLAFFALMLPVMTLLGFLSAAIETRLVAQPMLEEKLGPSIVVGRVMVINYLPDGYRLWLDAIQVEGLAESKTPRRVRVKVRYQEEVPEPGRWVSVKAILYPLSGPAEPGAFDFRRHAFYQGYGGTGFSVGKWRYAEGPEADFSSRVLIFFEKVRTHIAGKVFTSDKDANAAVASALITGDQSAINRGTLQTMRISGISHILSVSGLHITLVAGIVFFSLRALMAMVPWIALHWPIKKIAAFVAMLAALFYTMMCAAPVPAVRALLMSGILLIAIMVDRRAISMRLVALTALLSLLVAPSALLDPSFQLSFGAVMALIAVYEKDEKAIWQKFRAQGLLGKAALYLFASVLTSLVASIATTPLILYHFQQITWYGVLANLIAMPLSSFIIMPAAILTVLLMPFGWESWPYLVMREGIGWMLGSATWVASLPGAVTYHPAMAPLFLVITAAGGLWVCLWRQNWRFLGLVPFFLGSLGFLLTARPDILVADDGATVAVLSSDGKRIVRAADEEDFTVKVWLQRDGLRDKKDFYNWFEVAEKGGGYGLICHGDNCLYRLNNVAVAFPMTAPGHNELCKKANLVIVPEPRGLCRDIQKIERQAVTAYGSHALFLEKKVKIRTAKNPARHRQWD